MNKHKIAFALGYLSVIATVLLVLVGLCILQDGRVPSLSEIAIITAMSALLVWMVKPTARGK